MRGATYKKGEIIFREGETGKCMYDIFWGRVGIYTGYGTPQEKLLAELKTEDFFGEMGLLDGAPRSATAVSLSDETQLGVITEGDFNEYFQEKPAKVFTIMQSLSQKLRKTTQDYLDVCHAVYDVVEEEKAGKEGGHDPKLEETLLSIYNSYLSYPFLDMY
ncbi:MAG: cyclic nucleotide-binding domain-containing protein [Firmicutes bacterium]|nr:cyclic nucleotide-binding domain-containing protein [Bacillota bacterium]